MKYFHLVTGVNFINVFTCKLQSYQNKLVHFEIMLGNMHTRDSSAYFARAVSYWCKVFIKPSAGVNIIKLFFVTEEEAK
jgi:hypothetical protein